MFNMEVPSTPKLEMILLLLMISGWAFYARLEENICPRPVYFAPLLLVLAYCPMIFDESIKDSINFIPIKQSSFI